MMTSDEIEEAIADKKDLSRGDFSGRQDLNDEDFSGGKFDGSTFAGSNLDGTLFQGAKLSRVDFTGANLCGADFYRAVIEGANFTNANLDEAAIDGAEGAAIGLVVAGSDSRGYTFYGVWYDERGRHWNEPYHGWMVKAGCRYFTMLDAKAHWGSESGHPLTEEIMPLIERIEATPAPTQPAR